MAPPPNSLPSPASANSSGLVDRVNVGMQVRRYLKILGRRWILFTLSVLAGVGYMAYKAYTAPDMFRAVFAAVRAYLDGSGKSQARRYIAAGRLRGMHDAARGVLLG